MLWKVFCFDAASADYDKQQEWLILMTPSCSIDLGVIQLLPGTYLYVCMYNIRCK